MLPCSNDVNAMPRKLCCKLEMGNNTITDVKMLTYSTEWNADLTIGIAVSAGITATIPTPSFNLTGANVTLSMGIGSPVEWVKIGEFSVDENSVRNRQGYTSFSAFDKLYTNTINTYQSALSYPTTLQAVLNEVCSQIGITSATLGVSFTVNEDILSGFTLRDVLGFCAAMVGKNAYLSPNGALELRWFTASGYTADNTRANVPYIGENNCTVERLICNAADGVIISGSGGQGIYFTCPLMTQGWLDWLQGQLSGFTYRKADVNIPFGNFCLQSGDIITVTTTGSSLTVPIMSNSWTYDGGLSSDVSANGVSDYTGTADNAMLSISSRRVQAILETKRTKKREQQQYTSLQGEIQNATDLITGANGGHIRITWDGTSGYPAQILIMDTEDIGTAQNVWAFNQNGLGHFPNGYGVGNVNLALTMDGHVVAERIAGTKISGVILETFYKASSGTQSHIMVENGSYTINKATVDSSGDIVGTPTTVGKLHFIDRAQMQGDRDTVSIQVQPGNAFTIGTLDQNNPAGLGNSEFYYYSDLNTAPSGAKTFIFYANHTQNDGVAIFGDVFFDRADQSLKALKSTVDGIYNDIHGSGGILDRLDDLERRVTALGG